MNAFKSALVVAMTFFLFTGCKKEESEKPKATEPEYYTKFKVDGVQKTYQFGSCISFNNPSEDTDGERIYSESLIGNGNEFNDGISSLIISCYSYTPLITSQTYMNSQIPKENCVTIDPLLIIYTDENGTQYASWGDFYSYDFFGVRSSGEVNFTEVTDTYIKGTFSGVLYNEDFTKQIKLTDGEFKLKFF